MTGHEACVEALLQHGASVCIRDSRGRTAMHLAAACGHTAVLGPLLHASQSLNTVPVIMDNCGYTPLHWACYNGTFCFPLFLRSKWFWIMSFNSLSCFWSFFCQVMILVWRHCWNRKFSTGWKEILLVLSIVRCKLLFSPA